MRWIKLYGNTLNDKRLLDIRNDYGFQGIGVYCALLLQVECLGEGAQHIDTLTGLFNRKVSRKLIQSVLLDYGLFTVDQLGMVRSKDRIPGYSPEDMTELRRTDAIVPYAENALVGEDKTNQEEITIKLRFRKPTLDEVQAYCQERNNHVDAAQFIDYYESKGWMVGRNPMMDWKACVRTWERKRVSRNDNDSLRYENEDQNQSLIVNQPLIPSSAPPRPSPTAQWDFATDSWNEFY